MPCLILTGHPCSGKSTLARKIAARARQEHGVDVTIVSEAEVAVQACTADCYSGGLQQEKACRSALKNALDRALSNGNSLVIVDGLNEVKGFRYELFCVAKAAQQQYAVVWVLNSVETVVAWNEQRTEQAYSPELLQQLILRYEPPDERHRWDRPLYRLDLRPSQSSNAQTNLPEQLLDHSVYNMHALRDTLSTVSSSLSSSSAPTETAPAPTTTAAPKNSRVTFHRAKKKTTAPKVSNTASEPNRNASETKSDPTRAAPATETATQEVSPSPASNKNLDQVVDDLLQQFLATAPLSEGTSTRQNVARDTNVLNDMDSITQQVCTALAAASTNDDVSHDDPHQNLDVTLQGKPISLQCSNTMLRQLSSEELSRLRRDYLQWVALHPPEDCSSHEAMAQSFVDYMHVRQSSSSSL